MVHMKNRCTDESRKKVLSMITEEWQSTIDIAHWAELSNGFTNKCLRRLYEEGKIEKMFDSLLGKWYWRLNDGRSSLHMSSKKENRETS
jgi:hypothetical protein